eukprot:TRINITY_DN792_c0_g1_i8.p1 TRINITY_DN792_c0_g1~~TRINITY_DN792_c0_g1_i8.p1  ORF type:complete len:309 (-),score=-21.17 TRINITY_DN792_c0_g1_i8:19-945(-)
MRLAKQTQRSAKRNHKLMDTINGLREEGLINMEAAVALEKFDGDRDLILQLLTRKSKSSAYSEEVKEFAFTLHFHSPKNVLGSVAANCIAQDETVVLSLSSASFSGLEFQQQFDIMEFSCSYESGKENDVENHFCTVRDCKVCSATIAYIDGFYCKVFHSALKCIECRSALKHSEIDPCPNRSLILMKNYYEDEKKGLLHPSGSLCELLYHTEEVLRSKTISFYDKKAIEKLTYICLLKLKSNIFSSVNVEHCSNTAIGTENHFNCLIHLVLKKYLSLRLKKLLKDDHNRRGIFAGNFIHRQSIFRAL